MSSSQLPLYYYLNEQQEPVGPVTLETIGALVSSGRLPASVFVARAGDAEWVPYSAWCAASSAPTATPVETPSRTPLPTPLPEETEAPSPAGSQTDGEEADVLPSGKAA